MSMSGMTKGERDELLRLVKKREQVLKKAAEARSSELLAQFEAQSATIYAYDDDAVWRRAAGEASEAVRKAQDEIMDRCKALGIPPEFAPSISVSWHGRGQNALERRRDELRRAAKTRIEAIEADALRKIENLSLEAQTAIVSSGIETAAARDFLGGLATIESLMPPTNVEDVQALVDQKRAIRNRNQFYAVE